MHVCIWSRCLSFQLFLLLLHHFVVSALRFLFFIFVLHSTKSLYTVPGKIAAYQLSLFFIQQNQMQNSNHYCEEPQGFKEELQKNFLQLSGIQENLFLRHFVAVSLHRLSQTLITEMQQAEQF